MNWISINTKPPVGVLLLFRDVNTTTDYRVFCAKYEPYTDFEGNIHQVLIGPKDFDIYVYLESVTHWRYIPGDECDKDGAKGYIK